MDYAWRNFNYGGRTVLNSYNLRITIYECAKVKMEREIETLKHQNAETLKH